jgi:MSHA biogenesis protein MshI
MECRLLGLLKKPAARRGRIGLALGANQLAVAVVRGEGTGAVLERCELWPLEPAESAAERLKAAALPHMPVSSVLAAGEYQLVLVEAPDVPPAELKAAMRWRLKDSIDFRIEDAVIDVFEVPEQSRRASGRMMYAVAARRSVIERHAGALSGAAPLEVIDVPELCLRNLAALMPAASGGIALLHLGASSAAIILARARTFYFARQMELKPWPGSDPAVRLDPESVVLELQRSLDYYERHFDQPPITRVVVAPADARSETLAQELKRDSGLDVELLDLNVLLRCATPLSSELQAKALLAVGAALREEHRSL